VAAAAQEMLAAKSASVSSNSFIGAVAADEEHIMLLSWACFQASKPPLPARR